MNVGTGMGFQQGRPATNKYNAVKQAIKNELKMLAHKNTNNPLHKIRHLFESFNIKPTV
jgi:hypothetical protein